MSANTLESHEKWIEDINEIANTTVKYPIIADKSRKIAYLYDMIDYQDTTNVDSKGMALTIRAVFFIDPKKIIRAIIYYPASTGRNSSELLRVIDSLQLTDKYNLVTPVNWKVSAPPNRDTTKLTCFIAQGGCHYSCASQQREGEGIVPWVPHCQAISSIYCPTPGLKCI